jgi:hypothetical protein
VRSVTGSVAKSVATAANGASVLDVHFRQQELQDPVEIRTRDQAAPEREHDGRSIFTWRAAAADCRR